MLLLQKFKNPKYSVGDIDLENIKILKEGCYCLVETDSLTKQKNHFLC